MSLVEFKNKKNPRNKIVIGISAFLILFIIIGISSAILGLGYRTTRAESDIVIDKIDSTALVIKSEKVYSPSGGNATKLLKDEGVRVAVGEDIIQFSNTNQAALEQLERVEKQIKDLGIKYYSEEENINILNDIQNKINEGSYNDIHDYIENMNSSGHDNLVSQQLETLLIRQEELKKLVSDSSRNVTANVSGIVSYMLDGYEEILKPGDFQNYTYDTLDFQKISDALEEDNEINIDGDNYLFKIIHDYIWYIALKIDDSRILEFEEGQVYSISLSDNETLRGRIVTINQDDSKGIIIIEFKDKLHEYYTNRLMEVSLIKSQSNAYKIPTRSIIVKDGQAGVYINHIYGIVKFLPVNIIASDDDNTYVDRGDNNAYITIDGEKVRTITEFDEIFLSPTNLEENQILR